MRPPVIKQPSTLKGAESFLENAHSDLGINILNNRHPSDVAAEAEALKWFSCFCKKWKLMKLLLLCPISSSRESTLLTRKDIIF